MQFGATWYSLEHRGGVLCRLVQFGADWCNLVLFGADWCSLVKFGRTWCRLVHFGATLVQFGRTWCRWCNLDQIRASWYSLEQVGGVCAYWWNLVYTGAV